MNLHELEQTRLAFQVRLDDMLEASGGEVTDEVDELANMILTLDEAIGRKLDKYGYVIRCMKGQQAVIAERAATMKARSLALQNTIDRLEELAKDYIERNVPEGKVEGEVYTISVQKNGGVLPLEIYEGMDPNDYPGHTIVRREWDTGAIRQALEDGYELQFARLGERGTHLRIR